MTSMIKLGAIKQRKLNEEGDSADDKNKITFKQFKKMVTGECDDAAPPGTNLMNGDSVDIEM